MGRKMKAWVQYGLGDVRLSEVDIPQPGPNEVLIRIEVCGICPSDLRWFYGTRPLPESLVLPRVLGHEWVGEVVEVGKSVELLHEGDRVAAFEQVACGVCENCRRALFNFCLNPQSKIRGGFAQYGCISADGVVRIPAGLKFEEAAFAEPLACCINGNQRCDIQLGEDVVIIGVGPIGLLHVQLARLRGAHVIAVDKIASRLNVALAIGAHEVVNADEVDSVTTVRGLCPHGADAIIVAVGSQDAIVQGIQMAGLHARINIFAGKHPPTNLPIDSNTIHYQELILTGSYHFTAHCFHTAIKLLQYGLIDTKPLISNRLPLSKANQGFELVKNQQGLKVLVFPQG